MAFASPHRWMRAQCLFLLLCTMQPRRRRIGARIVRHGRLVTFQMAEVMLSRGLLQQILAAVAALRPLPPARCR
jgi:hypothetical protein